MSRDTRGRQETLLRSGPSAVMNFKAIMRTVP